MEGDTFAAVRSTIDGLKTEIYSLTDEEIYWQSDVIQKEDGSEWFDNFKKEWIEKLADVAQRLVELSSAEHRRQVNWPRAFNRVGFTSQIHKSRSQLDMPYVVVHTVKDLLRDLAVITVALWQKSGGINCAICGTLAPSVCTGCSRAYYCGTQCQKTDWPTHRQGCLEAAQQSTDVGMFGVWTPGTPTKYYRTPLFPHQGLAEPKKLKDLETLVRNAEENVPTKFIGRAIVHLFQLTQKEADSLSFHSSIARNWGYSLESDHTGYELRSHAEKTQWSQYYSDNLMRTLALFHAGRHIHVHNIIEKFEKQISGAFNIEHSPKRAKAITKLYRAYLGPVRTFGTGKHHTTMIQDLSRRRIDFSKGASLGYATIVIAARQFLLLADMKYAIARIVGQKFIDFYRRLEDKLQEAGFTEETL